MRYFITLLAILSLFSAQATAQTFTECADISGDGKLDVGDLVRMFEAVMGNLTLPAGKGDIDGRQGFNAGDIRYFSSWLFQGIPDGSCPPFPAYPLATGEDTVFLPSYDVPAGSGTFALPVIMRNTEPVTDLVLPMKIVGMDASMVLDSFHIGDEFRVMNGPAIAASPRVDEIGFIMSWFVGEMAPGVHILGTAHFHHTASGGSTVSMDTTTFSAAAFTNYVYGSMGMPPNYANTTVAVPTVITAPISGHPNMTLSADTLLFSTFAGYPDPDPQSFTVQSDGASFEWFLSASSTRVDVDKTTGMSGESVAVTPDIQGLPVGMHYYTVTVYSTGALGSPQTLIVAVELRQQFPSLDANCDGVYTLTDIIVQVNYLFRNGALPCNPCTGETN